MRYPQSPRRPVVDPYQAQVEYYNQSTVGSFALHRNRRAYDEYFRSTEPDGKLPKHSRAMSTIKAKMIMATFISRLILDVIRNSKWGFAPSNDLPNRRAYRHPLSDDQFDKPDEDPEYEPPEPLAAVSELPAEAWVVETTAEIVEVENVLAEMEFLEVGSEVALFPEFGISLAELAIGVGRALAGQLLVTVIALSVSYGIGILQLVIRDGKYNRRKRSQVCLNFLLTILKYAADDVQKGYAGNRALRSETSAKRYVRRYRSRN